MKITLYVLQYQYYFFFILAEQRRRSVQFNEEVEVVTTAPTLVEDLSTPEVSEEKIDSVLQLLHEADPTQPESDPPELPVQVRVLNC